MKQIITSLVLLASIFVNATIRTVSNSPATLAQFSTIQAAVNASASGDTIYVHGSPNAYATFTITNKQLVIMPITCVLFETILGTSAFPLMRVV